MALSYTDYAGGTAVFTVDWLVLEPEHIKVTINGVAETDFTLSNGNQTITLDEAAAGGTTVRIYRETPGTTASAKVMLVDFEDGSVLTESDLDTACNQLLYIAQEYGDSAVISLQKDSLGIFDAESVRIGNIANAVNAQDAVTKSVFDASLVAVGGTTIAPQIVSLATGYAASYSAPNTVITITGVVLNTYQNTRVICTVGGVVQRPDTDFTVAAAGADTTLTILGENITNASVTLFPISIQIPY